jgi:hypothetical protein
MGYVEDDPRRHGLRAGFDMAAEDYQRTRPVCPPRLFDDLIDRAGLKAGDRVIEIGCGTGQATVQEDYRAVGFEGDPPPPPGQIVPRRSGAPSSSPG